MTLNQLKLLNLRGGDRSCRGFPTSTCAAALLKHAARFSKYGLRLASWRDTRTTQRSPCYVGVTGRGR